MRAATTHIQKHDSIEPVEVNADVSTNTQKVFKAFLSSRRAMRNIEKTCEVPESKKIADDIDGEYSGQSVSLSADGRIVAVGSIYDNSSGHTRVYKLNDSDDAWIEVGNDMVGESFYDDSGQSTSLSADGRSVAIGAPGNYGTGSYSGHVRVYKLNDSDNTWIIIGNDIDG